MAVDYKIEFRDVNDDFWRVWIRDTTGVGNTTTTLKAATGSPLVIRTVNNDEDPFVPVRGKEVSIYYLNEDGSKGIGLFVNNSPDDRWKVEVERVSGGTTTTVFVGFLMLDDLKEPLKSSVNIVELKATDKIGSLKDVQFRDFDGNQFDGCYPLIKLIAMALKGTGLSLNINVCSSVTFKNGETNEPFFEKAFVDASMFKSYSVESEKSYTVLESILGNMHYITQYEGEWYIMNVDDMDGASISKRIYSSTGVYSSSGSFSKIGTIPYFINNPGNTLLNRPVKHVKCSYNINVSDLLTNQQYTKGDKLTGVDYSNYETGGEGGYGEPSSIPEYYALEGWTLNQVDRTAGNISSPNATACIKRNFVYGSEYSRHIQIKKPTTGPWAPGWNDYILENNARVPVRKGDRVVFSLEARFAGYINSSAMDVACAQVLLYSYTGEVYALVAETAASFKNVWKKVTTSNEYNKNYWWRIPDVKSVSIMGLQYGTEKEGFGTTTWASVTNTEKDPFGSEPVVEDGCLVVRLCNFTSEYYNGMINLGHGSVQNPPAVAYYRNVKLEIKSVAGFLTARSYGWIYRCEKTGRYNNVVENNLKLDNADALIFDGCLLQNDSNVNNLFGYKEITRFDNKRTNYETYGKMVCQAIWNQHNRVTYTVEGEIHNLIPDLTVVYSITGISNKKWMALNFAYDVKNCIMNGGQFREIYDSVAGRENKTVERYLKEPE